MCLQHSRGGKSVRVYLDHRIATQKARDAHGRWRLSMGGGVSSGCWMLYMEDAHPDTSHNLGPEVTEQLAPPLFTMCFLHSEAF